MVRENETSLVVKDCPVCDRRSTVYLSTDADDTVARDKNGRQHVYVKA